MHYLDPARPLLPNGRRCYIDANGKTLAAIGAFAIEPLLDGTFCVSTYLRNGYNSFTFFSATVSNTQEFFLALAADPEKCFMDYFGYSYVLSAPKEAPTVAVSLDDLGL